MSVVDKLARKAAEQAVRDGMRKMVVMFPCNEDWLKVAGPYFARALVGGKPEPLFTADQITRAFDDTITAHKYATMPKPADVLAMANERLPLPKMQKTHTDPTPRRQWTPEERDRNRAAHARIMEFIEVQNADPAYKDALQRHGRGSRQLRRIINRQKEEMRKWLERGGHFESTPLT